MSLPEETKPPALKMMMKIELKCMILTFSRIFMLDSAKELAPPSAHGTVVHWLNAINPELFTEQAIRYVKKKQKNQNTHHTTHKSSYSRYAYACSHTNSHAHTVPYARPSHTHLHPLYREPYVRVCGAAASYSTCGCATRLPRCSGLQA